jgi:glutamate synthase domain-containing protein 3
MTCAPEGRHPFVDGNDNENHVLIGNTALYGAIAGEAYSASF